MSDTSVIHQTVHKRFKEVFGPPSSALGRDDHWSLKLSVPKAPAISVLVNGTAEIPAVWVFDPHVENDGVMRVAVHDEATLNDTITKVLDRVKAANQKLAGE
jgi:hypothetical protein